MGNEHMHTISITCMDFSNRLRHEEGSIQPLAESEKEWRACHRLTVQ